MSKLIQCEHGHGYLSTWVGRLTASCVVCLIDESKLDTNPCPASMANRSYSIQQTWSGPFHVLVPIKIDSVVGNNAIVYKIQADHINSEQPADEHGFWDNSHDFGGMSMDYPRDCSQSYGQNLQRRTCRLYRRDLTGSASV